jgi:hypothetical protein
MIDPFDGFVNFGCGRESDHPMQHPSGLGKSAVCSSSQ